MSIRYTTKVMVKTIKKKQIEKKNSRKEYRMSIRYTKRVTMKIIKKKQIENKRIAVIGAGAAGMMAAGRAAELGADIFVFEKNAFAGKKLAITGKGRCNITNTAGFDDLIANIPGNNRFLYSSLKSFGNNEVIDFFKSLGVDVVRERGGRVFPLSGKAFDIVDALKNYCRQGGVNFLYNSPVDRLVIENVKDGIPQVKGLVTESGYKQLFDKVLISTGGKSYPGTGSTGDGYRMAMAVGHGLVEPKPSLVPLVVEEKWVSFLEGLSLRNIKVDFFSPTGKKINEEFGEMLFTDVGVSGPVILSGSRHLAEFGYKGCTLSVDLKPALSHEMLYNRVMRDFEKYSRKQYGNSLDDLLPGSLIDIVVMLSGIEREKPANQITRAERKILVDVLKGIKLTITKTRGFEEAIITAGGIPVTEINPKTMESRIVRNLYFAGEIIDVDGYTGGYNLTIAFSTGFAAGSAMAVP